MSLAVQCDCKPHSNRRLPCDHVLIDLFGSGISQTEIAERFGVGSAAVSLHAIRLGYGRPEKGKCAVEDCAEDAVARDWCTRHYSKWHKTGDPAYEPPPLKGHGTEASYQRGCRCADCSKANTSLVLLGTDDLEIYDAFRARCDQLGIAYNEGRRRAIAEWSSS